MWVKRKMKHIFLQRFWLGYATHPGGIDKPRQTLQERPPVQPIIVQRRCGFQCGRFPNTCAGSFQLDRTASRSLHTFVPLPPLSVSPTMVTHGGIPSHMVENPEPNLRPTTLRPPSYMERDHTSTNPVGIRSPVLMSDPDPIPGNPSSTDPGRGKPRTTIPVPVRSKQKASSTVDPQPKKRQKLSTPPDTPMSMVKGEVTPGPLPITSEAVCNALNSDDSDGDAASAAASAHDTEAHYGHRGESTSHVTIPPGTSTLTLTPNPKAPASPTYRILQPNPMDPPRAPPFRPWTNADDQELMSMKQDTKSRPSWKTIGARLHRDPQLLLHVPSQKVLPALSETERFLQMPLGPAVH